MPKKLKVIGVNIFADYGTKLSVQCRGIVAVNSQREAATAFDTSLHYIRGYGAETGNCEELAIALGEPGTVFYRPLDGRELKFKKLSKRRGK